MDKSSNKHMSKRVLQYAELMKDYKGKRVLFVNAGSEEMEVLLSDNLGAVSFNNLNSYDEYRRIYDDIIYPCYIENTEINTMLIYSNSLDELYRNLDKAIRKASFYEKLVFWEKFKWHLQYSFYVIDLNRDYEFSELYLTPIEVIMKKALESHQIEFEMQKPIGKYKVDFLVKNNGQEYIVECDGKEFHDKKKDEKRDAEIEKLFHLKTLRFTGSSICGDIEKCIKDIKKALSGTLHVAEITTGYAYKSRLDDKQLEAINHKLGACMVLAPAGSGKTELLVWRIIKLIEEGVEPNNILALTFTKKAQKEMEIRLRDILGKNISSEVEVRTYHSLAYSQFGQGKELFTNKYFYIVRKHMQEMNENYKNIQPDDIEIVIDKLIRFSDNVTIEESELFNAYVKALEEENWFDQNANLILYYKKLISNNEFRIFVQNKYRFILVDECQDNNALQVAINYILAAPQDNLFLVGDDDQCIFSFAGSDIRNITEAEKKYPAINKIYLENNYRSEPKIVEVATNVIVSNNKRELKIIRAKRRSQIVTPVVYHNYSEMKDEAIEIVKHCKEYANQLNRIGILYRKKYYIKDIRLELNRNKINYYTKDKLNVLENVDVNILHSYLLCINGIDDYNAWRNMLNHGMTYIKKELVKEIYDSANRIETIRCVINSAKDYIADGWRKFAKQFEELCIEFGGKDIKEAIIYLHSMLGFSEKCIDTNEKEKTGEAYTFYYSLSEKYSQLSEFIGKINELNSSTGDEEESKYNILLFTIHSSKGKQFDEVFFVGLNEGILPTRSKIIPKENMSVLEKEEYQKAVLAEEEEERRVCYVGMTRAINILHLCSVENNGTQSRFIGESLDPKMRCNVCEKSITRKDENKCSLCGDYFCPDHMAKCHVCGKNICKNDAHICRCGNMICSNCDVVNCEICGEKLCPNECKKCVACNKTLCDNHSVISFFNKKSYCEEHVAECSICGKVIGVDNVSKCDVCGKIICPEDVNKCMVCGKTLCVDHKIICSTSNEIICREHSVKCVTCGKSLSIEHAKTCIYCDGIQCGDCYKTIKCSECGKDFCNHCFKETNQKCTACRNIRPYMVSDMKASNLDNKGKHYIGEAPSYYIVKTIRGILFKSVTYTRILKRKNKPDVNS